MCTHTHFAGFSLLALSFNFCCLFCVHLFGSLTCFLPWQAYSAAALRKAPGIEVIEPRGAMYLMVGVKPECFKVSPTTVAELSCFFFLSIFFFAHIFDPCLF